MVESENTKAFKLNYKLEPSDLAAMLKDMETHRFLRTKTFFFWLLLIIMVCAVGLGLYWWLQGQEDAAKLMAIGLVGLIGIPLLRWGQPKASAYIYFKRLGLKDKTIETTISHQTIFSASNEISSNIKWESLKHISRSNSHHFLWINKIQAIIIPLRALADEADAEDLWHLIEERFLDCATAVQESKPKTD